MGTLGTLGLSGTLGLWGLWASADPDGAVVSAPPDRVDLDRHAEVRRVDHQSVADVNPDVADVGEEEDEIAGLQVVAGHVHA